MTVAPDTGTATTHTTKKESSIKSGKEEVLDAAIEPRSGTGALRIDEAE
jgi:hypothetical protein